VACIVEGSKSSDGVVEDYEIWRERYEERWVRNLPTSLCGMLKIVVSES